MMDDLFCLLNGYKSQKMLKKNPLKSVKENHHFYFYSNIKNTSTKEQKVEKITFVF